MKIFTSGALALMVVACAPLHSRPIAEVPAERLQTSEGDFERAAILKLRADHNRAIATGDIEAFLKIAADNYVSVFGGGTIIRSKEDLRRIWTERPQQCVRTPVRVEVAMVDGGTRAHSFAGRKPIAL